LVVSQFLTLYITPAIYIYLDKLRGKRQIASPNLSEDRGRLHTSEAERIGMTRA